MEVASAMATIIPNPPDISPLTVLVHKFYYGPMRHRFSAAQPNPKTRKMGPSTQIRHRYDRETNETAFRYEKTRFSYDNGLTPATKKDHLAARPICALGHHGTTTRFAGGNVSKLHTPQPVSSEDPTSRKRGTTWQANSDTTLRHMRHFRYKNLDFSYVRCRTQPRERPKTHPNALKCQPTRTQPSHRNPRRTT